MIERVLRKEVERRWESGKAILILGRDKSAKQRYSSKFAPKKSDGAFSAFEMKWNPKAKAKFQEAFIRAYQPLLTQIVHADNFEGFLGVE
jgi:hypothetical protein